MQEVNEALMQVSQSCQNESDLETLSISKELALQVLIKLGFTDQITNEC